jgi:hypothetical protein
MLNVEITPTIVNVNGQKFVRIDIPLDPTKSEEIHSKGFEKNGKKIAPTARVCWTRAIIGDLRVCTIDGDTVTLRFKEGYCPDLEKKLPPRFELVGPSWEIKTEPGKAVKTAKKERELAAF